MKKHYQSPATEVVKVELMSMFATSQVNAVSGNTDISLGNPNNAPTVARGRRGNLWDDEE